MNSEMTEVEIYGSDSEEEMFEKEEFIRELINIHKNNGNINKSEFIFG